MGNFILGLREKISSLSRKQKILLAVAFFIIFVVLILFLAYRVKDREKEFVGRSSSKQTPRQVSQSIGGVFLEKISQFLGRGEKVEVKPLETLPSAPTIVPTATPASSFSHVSIIEETLGYIQSQRLDDGFYNYIAHYNEQCETKEGEMTCPFGGKWTFPQANTWTSLAYLAGYQALGEQKYLGLAKRDIDQLILYCDNNPKKCIWVLVQPAKLYEVTYDSRYLNFLKTEGELLLTNSDPDSMLSNIEITELAILYGLTKDNRYLEEAKKRLKLSENNFNPDEVLYKTEKNFLFPQNGCWQTLAKIELGKQTGEKHYSDQVKIFLYQADIVANLDKFPHPVEIQPCIETYFELAKASGEEKYYQQGKELLEKFIKTFWDGKETKLIYGEGGTIFNPHPERLTYGQKYVVLTDSAYSVYLLNYLKEGQK